MLRRGKSHAPDSEASSLGPSDSASQQTRIDNQVINDLMEMVEPPPICHGHVGTLTFYLILSKGT